MTDKAKFVTKDGTLLDGKDAELELARHDAEKMLKELQLDTTEKEKQGKKGDAFKGKGRQLRSSKGPRPSSVKAKDGNGPSSETVGSLVSSSSQQGISEASRQTRTDSSSLKSDFSTALEHGGTRRESEARSGAAEEEMKEKIKGVSSQMGKDSGEIWRFSKDAEQTVYYFSLDVDTLWNKVSRILDTVQEKINEAGSTLTAILDHTSGQTDSAINMLEKWGDMSKNIKDGSEFLKGKVKDKTSDITGFAKNLNDKGQQLAKSANANLSNPLLQNVADMSGVSDSISEMAGTGQYLTDSFTSVIESQSSNLQMKITEVSESITAMGESSGLFRFIKDLAGEISHYLTELSKLIKQIREKVGSLLNKINGLFELIYTGLAKLSSIIEGVLGLDIGLMKEALKNGTIRLADVRVGRVGARLETEVKTKSSTDINGAKVTAGNISAAGIVKDNSKSGHIEVAAVDFKAANVDAAILREGKVKRNLAYLKGANINAGNVRATAIDDREVETAVVGASAAEVNVGNVVVEGLGKKGTYKNTTAQPSLTVGNVAVGIRRSTGTNIRAGPSLSAFNVDLTVGAPSVTNVLNQLAPGQAFGNLAIPFLGGGGGGEAGGKSSGPDGNGGGEVGGKSSGTDGNGGEGTNCESEQDAGFSSAQDFVVYGRPGDGFTNSDMRAKGYGAGGPQVTDRDSQSNARDGKSIEDSESSSTVSTSIYGLSKTNGSKTSGVSGGDGKIQRDTQHQTNQPGSMSGGINRAGGSGAGLRNRGTSSEGTLCDIQGETLTGRMNLNKKGRSRSPGFGGDPCNTNNLSSGVYKTGDAARETPEDYQSRLADLVEGQVQRQVGKSKKKEEKKSDKKEKKEEPLDNETFKRLLQQQCKDQLDEAGFYTDAAAGGSGSTAGGSGGKSGEAGATAGTEEGKGKKVKKPKPKAKPWGEHGNIHGFSTLGTECDKEIKKLGEGIFGFTDGD